MSAMAHCADSSQGYREVREVPIVLQKSPSGLCEIEICNYRIGAPVLLNRCCAFQPDLESIFLAEMLKILLQHNLPSADIGACGSAFSGVHSRTEPLESPGAKCHPGQNSPCPRRSRPCASRGPSRRRAHDD